jgi:hypothetical protein
MRILERGVLLAFACAMSAGTAASAQTAEIKEKPPLYTYVASWTIPRAHWGEMAKQAGADSKIFDKGISSGTIVGYGEDEDVVHDPEGQTHDEFWQSPSMAGLLGALDEIQKGASPPVFASATKHADYIFVSRFYNWKSGTIKAGFTHEASYKLKADAPDDAVETLSRNFIVPLLEKLLAEGSIQEYEIDEEAVHKQGAGLFWVLYIAQTAAGIDKVNAALAQAVKADAFAGPALGALVDFTQHRDSLARTNATYK